MDELKKFRRSKRYKISEMATELKISHSLYSQVENGAKKPSRNFMERFKARFPEYDMNKFF
jgi:transcriptional regulator with XRE-family HTH domain